MSSFLDKLTSEVHLVISIIAFCVFIIWEVWSHSSKKERPSYRAYLWVILIFVLAANLSTLKLLDQQKTFLSDPHFAHKDALKEIASKNRVRIGISHVAWGPFFCLDEEKVEINGFDIEVAGYVVDAIRNKLKKQIRPQFSVFDWEDLFRAVQNNDVDFIISAITITTNREHKWDLIFSHPYYRTRPTYAVFKESEKGQTFAGRPAIVIEQTSSYDVAKALVDHDRIQLTSNWFEAFKEFRAHRDKRPIIFDDDSLMRYRLSRLKLTDDVEVHVLRQENFPQLKGQDPPLWTENYGIGVQREQEDLLQVINTTIDQMVENHTLDQLELKWLKGASKRCLKEFSQN
jgi:polar amino acid transport system substrate-binding protein